jgi:hypothetical protein
MIVLLISIASMLGVLSLYGYCGRFAVSRGYKPGESGSILELALPLYIRLAPHLLVSAACVVIAAALIALLT